MRKHLAIILAFALTGCGTNVAKVVDATTTTIVNPIRPVDIYRVKVTYAAALGIVVEYRRFCWSKPYATLMADPTTKSLCQSRRWVVRQAQVAKARAKSAIASAEKFIRDNPTVNATTVVFAAWDAVKDFQLAIPTIK
jgi:hypothetical protein